MSLTYIFFLFYSNIELKATFVDYTWSAFDKSKVFNFTFEKYKEAIHQLTPGQEQAEVKLHDLDQLNHAMDKFAKHEDFFSFGSLGSLGLGKILSLAFGSMVLVLVLLGLCCFGPKLLSCLCDLRRSYKDSKATINQEVVPMQVMFQQPTIPRK